MFGWFKKKPKPAAYEAIEPIAAATEVAPALELTGWRATAPVEPVPAPIPVPQLAVPQTAAPLPPISAVLPVARAAAPVPPIDPHDYQPAPAKIGMAALMLAPSGARRLIVTSVQAGGRRVLARETASQRSYAFTRHADGNYYLGDAQGSSAATLIVGLPLARAAA